MIDVFVSRPTWVAPEFEAGLKMFLTRLDDLGLRPHSLGTTDRGTKTPLDDVVRLVKQCKGAVILGYPQITLREGAIKGRAIAEPVLLATEWNHMEAGLAYAEGLPLLVIHHVGVVRGVFDRGAINSFLFAKKLDTSDWCSDDDISGALRTWRDEVLGSMPTSAGVRSSTYQAIDAHKTELLTARGIGRRIGDPRPLENGYREGAECRVEELTEYYVRLLNTSTGQRYTVPLGDITVSFDDSKVRPMIEVRRKGL